MAASLPLILIVDDDKDFRELLAAKISAKGFIVKTASGGNDGIAMAKKYGPGVILMDVDMPDKDGIAVTQELQSDPHTKNIKVIFVSNLGDAWPQVAEQNRRLAQQIGAVNYFKKGGDLDVLVEKIRETLAR